MLFELFQASQGNDQEAMLELTRKFHPLLGKYGRKLGYEDELLPVKRTEKKYKIFPASS